MPRDGAITFIDLVDKLDVLRIECDKTVTPEVSPRPG
jgi:hypothetical protein